MPRAKNKSRKISATLSGLTKEAVEQIIENKASIRNVSKEYAMPFTTLCIQSIQQYVYNSAMYTSINFSSILQMLFLNQDTIAGKYFRMLKRLSGDWCV